MGKFLILRKDLSVPDPYGSLGVKGGIEAVGGHDDGGTVALVKLFEKGQNSLSCIVVE